MQIALALEARRSHPNAAGIGTASRQASATNHSEKSRRRGSLWDSMDRQTSSKVEDGGPASFDPEPLAFKPFPPLVHGDAVKRYSDSSIIAGLRSVLVAPQRRSSLSSVTAWDRGDTDCMPLSRVDHTAEPCDSH